MPPVRRAKADVRRGSCWALKAIEARAASAPRDCGNCGHTVVYVGGRKCQWATLLLSRSQERD
jgi:hypothetical protein